MLVLVLVLVLVPVLTSRYTVYYMLEGPSLFSLWADTDMHSL